MSIFSGRHQDDHRLFVETDNSNAIYMASRLVPNAVPFDALLLKPFRDNKVEEFADKASWLEKCKADLSASITELHGLGSAIMVRHIMGESADLGPDNMLVVANGDAQHVVNIDVTGFRYARRSAFVDPRSNETRLGWEEVLKSDDQAGLLNSLLDKSVFSKRFVADAKDISKDDQSAVMQLIVDVLKDKVAPYVQGEVASVRDWLQSQNTEYATESFRQAAYRAYAGLNPVVKPQARYFDKVVAHASTFISDCVKVANEISQVARPEKV